MCLLIGEPWQCVRVLQTHREHTAVLPLATTGNQIAFAGALPDSCCQSCHASAQTIEFTILESLAWRHSEPLLQYTAQPAIRKFLQSKFIPRNPVATPNRTPPPVPNAATGNLPRLNLDSPNDSSPAPERRVPHLYTVHLFYRRLEALAADRIKFLCGPARLDLPKHLVSLVRPSHSREAVSAHHAVLDQIWDVVMHSLASSPTVLKDRHLDTVILCCVFAVCVKLAQVKSLAGIPLSFKRIVGEYVARWQSNSVGVVRRICLRGSVRGNIVKFYNEVFVDHVKVYLVKHIKPRVVPVTSLDLRPHDLL